MELFVRPDVDFTWESTPLETSEDLQKLLEQIDQEYTDSHVTIYLPAAVYEGDIIVDGSAVTLKGVSEGEGETVFKGKLNIRTEAPQPVSVNFIHFEGENAGIDAINSFFAENCSFEGMETGISATENAWPMIYRCSFTDCGTGLYVDSETSARRNVFFGELQFIRNRNGVILKQLPGEDVLFFVDCVFEENETDLENTTAHEISYSLDGL